MELVTSVLLALSAIVLGVGLIAYGLSGFRRKGGR
ncbi:unannotated protein [freshwater metagenome]|uniref:Unannotated protein n=1 Tax=freshwater metagenome TaxID=449393 RepID=A0A6J6NS70_9ZZZZ